ncbi:lysophospholipid acyltransferase family protein [Candidatus Pelagibacter sp.]|jgi:KDO2-lipid IV(A) lauroyltransferase|uniref:lysophospholipid acyltransferase family protein n=1 Tax=Pelagibacter ubique TaxID=198252 RepID=UPI00094C6162|nr:lysophospholipid acyltransferase family protein [Candidatus Pelagibacter ubique]MDA9752767.1 lysophospholipid acyltransferase family protein [Candidatus Pelagibacter sp.]MDC2968720.1 lysophospholipid acyltransferase family protein [Candidatus Pelagibacter sp.]|tara:strand:+ start:1811 stop:2671 length:861 start_codon:yes stop_codon:yes gene_type:complete
MKTVIYFFEFVLVSLLLIIFKILGYKLASNFGFFIGKTFGPLFRSKSLVIDNLKKSNISLKKTHEQSTDEIFGNYGRIFAEYPFIKNFRNGKLEKYIQVEGKQYLDEIKSKNKKVVFISGHFNNFELMAMMIEKYGIDLSAIYRPLNNIFLNKTMEKIRIKYICKKQIKKGRSGTREIIENLKKGSSIALMIDQRVREGSKVNFFGSLATTTTIPAQLVKKYKCDLVPIYIERRSKFHFKMYVSKPIKVGESKTIEEITQFLNTVLEQMIVKNPLQWIWTHDRWKK